MISEKHCCCDCKKHIPVPVNPEATRYELVCLMKRREVNPDGGLTDCTVFEEKEK